jgi:hypothetical protein
MDNFSAHQLALELIEESDQHLKWTRIEWFPANTTPLYQPLDQRIIQNWKCLVKKELLVFLMTEFDSGRDYTKTHHVLRAITAWQVVESTTIINCWKKGIKIPEGPIDSWAESLDVHEEIQETANTLVKASRIQEIINIGNFIHPECHGPNAMRRSNDWFVLQGGLDKERRDCTEGDFNSRVA